VSVSVTDEHGQQSLAVPKEESWRANQAAKLRAKGGSAAENTPQSSSRQGSAEKAPAEQTLDPSAQNKDTGEKERRLSEEEEEEEEIQLADSLEIPPPSTPPPPPLPEGQTGQKDAQGGQHHRERDQQADRDYDDDDEGGVTPTNQDPDVEQPDTFRLVAPKAAFATPPPPRKEPPPPSPVREADPPDLATAQEGKLVFVRVC
jgi:hypothetical protein